MPELEKAAQKISGRTIKIKLASAADQTADEAPAAKPVAKRAKAAAASAVPSAQPPAQAAAVAPVISDEEPFVKGNFEADVPGAAAAQNTPEEVKEILDIFPGELLA